MALSFIGIGLGRKMDRIEDAKNNQGCEKLSDLEKEQLGRAFQQFDGNYRAMARALGISKHALYEKLKSYGILVEKIPQ
jgi:transcriptional regulator of acetoin/glycerol metabolism